MEAAIQNLANLSADTKVAILGDMFELGEESGMEHQKIADLAMDSNLDRLYLIGEAFAKTRISKKDVFLVNSFEEFKELFKEHKFKDTTFLIKASRGMALERVLDYL